MARNLVVCLDGTRNEPETGATNVARLFTMAVKSDDQLVHYDPGVGTLGARSATTRFGKFLTRVAGLLLGHGVKENIEEAYTFLMHNYRDGDRIFVFGFSRGAYTALALTGMIHTVGLLRPGADNLVPYAMKLYANSGPDQPSTAEKQRFWKLRRDFTATFGNPELPGPFDTEHKQIEFLGIWDAVKSIGWFNWRAQLQQARWPYTRKVTSVRTGRHAISIDENRRQYAEYRFDSEQLADRTGELREMWFAGVHSDVGGTFDDNHSLADIALKWMVDEAVAAGLLVDPGAYHRVLDAKLGEELPADHALGTIHANGLLWWLIGLGWRRREIRAGDEVHPSVRHRIEATRSAAEPYVPRQAG
jgi:uncharacterized protein (DUF2235 family)